MAPLVVRCSMDILCIDSRFYIAKARAVLIKILLQSYRLPFRFLKISIKTSSSRVLVQSALGWGFLSSGAMGMARHKHKTSRRNVHAKGYQYPCANKHQLTYPCCQAGAKSKQDSSTNGRDFFCIPRRKRTSSKSRGGLHSSYLKQVPVLTYFHLDRTSKIFFKTR